MGGTYHIGHMELESRPLRLCKILLPGVARTSTPIPPCITFYACIHPHLLQCVSKLTEFVLTIKVLTARSNRDSHGLFLLTLSLLPHLTRGLHLGPRPYSSSSRNCPRTTNLATSLKNSPRTLFPSSQSSQSHRPPPSPKNSTSHRTSFRPHRHFRSQDLLPSSPEITFSTYPHRKKSIKPLQPLHVHPAVRTIKNSSHCRTLSLSLVGWTISGWPSYLLLWQSNLSVRMERIFI